MQPIDIRAVRMFVTLADELSFRRAAERLHVAQPWLSVQIRKLEEQLGLRFLDRDRNRLVTLTAAGQAFLPAARTYLHAADEAAAAARAIQRRDHAILRIGAPDFSADIPARSRLLDAFAAHHPELELEIVNAWSLVLRQQLRAAEIDVALTIGEPAEDHAHRIRVGRYRWALLAPEPDRRDDGPIPLSALAGSAVAVFRRNINPPLYDSLASVLEAAGIVVVPLIEASIAGMHHHIERSAMPVLVGDWHGRDRPLPAGTRVIPIAPPAPCFELSVEWRPGDERPAVQAFWAMAAAMASTRPSNTDRRLLSAISE